LRQSPAFKVLRWISKQDQLAINVITLEELHFGLTRQSLHLKKHWLNSFIASQCLILPVIEPIACIAGSLRGELAREGITRHQADLLIAATALHHKLSLATRNTKDFTRCGLKMINPIH
jgi:toxin FitB